MPRRRLVEKVALSPPSRLGHVKLLIKNAKIVNDDATFEGEIFVEDGIIRCTTQATPPLDGFTVGDGGYKEKDLFITIFCQLRQCHHQQLDGDSVVFMQLHRDVIQTNRQVGKDIIAPGGCETIDAKGMLVMPGGVDPHTHLEFYFMGTRTADDFYTGTKAALAGGTTTVLDFVAKREPGMTLLEAFDDCCARAKEKACCDYGLHVILNEMNDQVEDEMAELVKRGVNSFKMFMAYKDALMLTDEDLIRGLKRCAQIGALAQVHAENGDIIAEGDGETVSEDENEKRLLKEGVTAPEGHLLSRDDEIEAEATNRVCILAHQVNCPLYVVHVMSKSAADVISHRRNAGQVVFGETLASAIGVDGSELRNSSFRHAAAHVMSPPIREDPKNREQLVNMIASGALSCIGSDHCVFDTPKKALGEGNFTKIPNGCNGVEERMAVLWEMGVNRGKIDPCQFVAATSTNAAKVFNLYPRKGRIAVGSDADIVVWDPQLVRKFTPANHHSAGDFNVFEKLICRGAPRFVVSRGRVVVNEGEVHVSQGWGRLLTMPVNGQHAFARIRARAALPPEATEDEVIEPPRSSRASAVASPAPSGGADSVDGASVRSGETPFEQRRPSRDIFPVQPQEFHRRPLTKGGSRNLQDSSFSLSGAQIDDNKNAKSSVRVHNPPGGRSHGIW
ncbi:dihydropyrimidinase-related protein 2-like [Tropilaelaps mercedesae]|uniref:dihydropyrimidinase n=1 Tax=Tropilaelaps mercedesae TaxID=418985 RepID=A0A1V9XIZ6_9ACAR|nr:dihydropyrimidinase-related protein 2-like [Tropilaelaps mercedesae]